ncbi:alpha-ketoacid dehydrogenase subunit alpha/beta [Salinibacter altiplanensis]|uniref:alpha-ketoacid dehydrogenase subunit alpha/beta n=1 Tax=Salinibacter altiplanensis TaxID=1803181 RepID=UPI001F3DCA4C|nr:dehydrogenase E1 component subunit alpha/beta [Salinibacter altiplanensis]
MATPEMQDTNDSDLDPQTNASSGVPEAESTEPELPDPPSSPDGKEAVEAVAEERPAESMHGDGHAAIPQIPSITSDGSIAIDELSPADFEPDDLRRRLRTMMLSRRLDEKMMTLIKQGKGHFHIGCAGHEAVQSAIGRYSRPGEGPGHDWFCFYYRDLCMALSLGMTTKEALLAHLAKADDPNSGGRQMPEHFGLKHLNVMTTASSVGAQFNPGVGFGFGIQQRGEDNYVYISCGDGATSQGDFHEALNWAAREQAPALFLVQDNKYAISVPIEEQTAGGTPYKLTAGYEGLSRMRVDGTDFFASASAAQAAIRHIREGNGPVCLVADVVRLLPHSSSDDHTKYRTPDELEADRKIDPIDRLQETLIDEGTLTREDAEALQEEVHEEVNEATEWVKQQDDPAAETASDHVFFEGDLDLEYNSEDDLDEDAEPTVMVDAINRTLKEEMARDESIVVYGEDVAGDKGGVFTATKDLTDEFGEDRCFNSPLAEGSIIGTAVGYAASGFTPVVEIQFADYIWPAMQQLRNQVAPFRYRSDGQWSCPMVVRVPCGGYIHGGLCHSQNVESIFGHTPGLKVALPSTAADAKGLLATAIRSEDPVLFLEHKALYRAASARTPRPPEDYTLPFGEARIAREGSDLTIITYGMMAQKSLNAAQELEQEGVDVEVVDLRTIVPLDSETILESVRKTNRALVVYEDHEFIGFGAELCAQIADDAFTHLDAPVRRVAGEFTPIPFAHDLERAVLPSDEGILKAARDLAAF